MHTHPRTMNLRAFTQSGHWPTLVMAGFYFFTSFIVWALLGPLAPTLKESLGLTEGQRWALVSVPYLSGAILRIPAGMWMDRFGAKRLALSAQILVLAALAAVWQFGFPALVVGGTTWLSSFVVALLLGLLLGVAGASFAVALPQAGRWYPAQIQGSVLGLVGLGTAGAAAANLLAPWIAEKAGWQGVFGWMLLPCGLVLVLYALGVKDAPGSTGAPKKLMDYWKLLKERDAHWFCFYYTVSFGGFAGLASYAVSYFTSSFGYTKVQAGVIGAVCAIAGALMRPVGGFLADRFGGLRVLQVLYAVAGVILFAAAGIPGAAAGIACFFLVQSTLGMANGAVFQLIPQRFPRELSLMSGLAGCGGGIGGFFLTFGLGAAKGALGSQALGFAAFGGVCLSALAGLLLVKTRWRTTWGATAQARI